MKRIRASSLLALALSCSVSLAQGYPEKTRPIRILLPFGVGSSTDLIARAYSRAMAEQSGVVVVVENRPGAEGVIGMMAAKNATPDGYTILLANSSTMVLNSHVLPSISYDPVGDFTPLVGVAKFSLVLNAGPSTKFANAQQLIDAARASPGKFTYGSGTASTRLAMEMLEHTAKVKMLAVPYKTLAEAATSLAAGDIDLVMNDAMTAIPYYKSGLVRPLAVTGPERMKALPAVPSLKEQGIASYELTGWFATNFPTNTPSERVQVMRDMLRRASASSHVANALKSSSFEPLTIEGDDLAMLQQTESKRWGRLLGEMRAGAR